MNEPIEDAIGQCGIADLLVPARDRKLRSEDGGARIPWLAAINIFSPIQELATVIPAFMIYNTV